MMQCNAFTKSGFRCNRMTNKPLCHQHISHLDFYNLTQSGQSLLQLNLEQTKTIINIRNTPDPTITILETDLQELPEFANTSTIIANNFPLQSISYIYTLTRLSLNNTLIQYIPFLPNLLYLSLTQTSHLQSIVSLPKLRNLYLQDSSLTQIPKMPELKILDISRTLISEILAPKLQNLTANKCPRLLEIKNIALTYLSIKESKVQYLQDLRKLRTLNASKSKELLILPYSNLEELDISFCPKILNIPNISTLRKINATGAFSLIRIPKNLDQTEVHFEQCPFLPGTVAFGNLALYNLSKIIKIQRFFRVYLRRKFFALNFGYKDLKTMLWMYMY